jgi:hypothetical protein
VKDLCHAQPSLNNVGFGAYMVLILM